MNIKYNQHLMNCDIPEIYRIFENKKQLNYTIKMDLQKFLSRVRDRKEEFRSYYYSYFTDNEERYFEKYVNEFSRFKTSASTTIRDHRTDQMFPADLLTLDSYFNSTLTFRAMEGSVFKQINFYPEELVTYSNQIVALAIIDNKYAYVKYSYPTEKKLEFLNQSRSITNSRDYRFIGYENIIPLEHLYLRMNSTSNFISDYEKELVKAKNLKEAEKLKEFEFKKRLKKIEEQQRQMLNTNRTIHVSTPTSSISQAPNPFLEFMERERSLHTEAWTSRFPIAENLSEQFRQQYMLSSNEIHTEQQADRLRNQMQEDHQFLANREHRSHIIRNSESNQIRGYRADTIIMDDIEF